MLEQAYKNELEQYLSDEYENLLQDEIKEIAERIAGIMIDSSHLNEAINEEIVRLVDMENLDLTKQQRKAIKELEKIRESGETNMFSKNRVVEIANREGYFNIVNEVTKMKGSRVVVDTAKYIFLTKNMG